MSAEQRAHDFEVGDQIVIGRFDTMVDGSLRGRDAVVIPHTRHDAIVRVYVRSPFHKAVSYEIWVDALAAKRRGTTS